MAILCLCELAHCELGQILSTKQRRQEPAGRYPQLDCYLKMDRQTSIWGRSKNRSLPAERWVEGLWILGLFLAAVLLFGINLDGLPLRDWDEGTVAQVAREIWQSPFRALKWLHPTLGGTEYFNKPPLVHLLIAGAYWIGEVDEWTTRLPGAMLTAISVPLLYGIGRELFRQRIPALFSALIYLTLLPVVRHGRLAMLDGPVLCFFLFMMWCMLRSRRDLRWTLGTGIGFGLICLTKGILGLLLGAIALIFLAWDTPRLLTSGYLWSGMLLGSAPVFLWYGAQLLKHGQDFMSIALGDQSFKRIWKSVDNHGGPPWYYLLEICKYGWPWLLFVPHGLRLAWENRNLSWAKLVLIWTGVYLVAISLMGTKLPWYVLPIYPAIALVGGAQLAEIWNGPSDQTYPRVWAPGLATLGLLAFGGSLYFGGLGPKLDWHLQLILVCAAFTFLMAAILMAQKDLQFIAILFWGTYLSLLIFVTSPHWIWELNEAYPVKPVATMIQRAMIKEGTPSETPIYTSFAYERPSLNFYSERKVIALKLEELRRVWEDDPQPFLLVDQSTFEKLSFKDVKGIDKAEGWLLFTKKSKSKGFKDQPLKPLYKNQEKVNL